MNRSPPRPIPVDPPLRQALDLLDSGVGFFSRRGRMIFANTMMRELIGDGGVLAEEVRGVVAEVGGAGGSAGGEGEVRVVIDRRVNVTGIAYRVRGGFVGFDLFRTGDSVIVAVERSVANEPPLVPHPRFKLTRREGEIAVRLAEGQTNDDIAKSLYLSSHTVRNYTRQVLRKLGVKNRAQVASRLAAAK